MTCDTAYSLFETIGIIIASLLIIGLVAVVVVEVVMSRIKWWLDQILGPEAPYPTEPNTPPPDGFMPVDRSAWKDTPSGGEVEHVTNS